MDTLVSDTCGVFTFLRADPPLHLQTTNNWITLCLNYNTGRETTHSSAPLHVISYLQLVNQSITFA
jgi:hypothetical protein